MKRHQLFLFIGCLFFQSYALANSVSIGTINISVTKLPSPSQIKATLFFDSVPTGINIRVNGKPAGITPYQGLDHRVGETVSIELSDKSYVPYKTKITLNSEFTQESPVALIQAKGKLLVTMNKYLENAHVLIDGKAAGTVPTRINLAVGMHTLSVQTPYQNSQPLSFEITIGEAKNMMFTVTESGEIAFGAEKINGYTKMSANGQWLDDSEKSWQCVLDNNTGLIWEIKTNDGGLRDKEWKYSREENPWKNKCYNQGRCDAQKYVEDVNAIELCGFNGWRLPEIYELSSLRIKPQWNMDDTDKAIKILESGGAIDPNIDPRFFPHTENAFYWSSTSIGHRVLGVDFFTGDPYQTDFPDEENYIRLVMDGS